MSNKLLTLVANENFAHNEIVNLIKEKFSLNIKTNKPLSVNAIELLVENIPDDRIGDIEKFFFQSKIDFCIKNQDHKDFKILLCDMDATMIANETLDDLVKITGSDFNVDETSKLAMEGKIDLRTTLKNRVEILKGKPKSLIQEVLKNIKFNPGSDILVKTLNSMGYESSLITGGFKPISTFVGEKLGFHNIISNEFEFDNNDCFTGEYIPITGEKNSKFKYMEQVAKDKNILFDQILSIGDGSNDLQMLKHSGLGIGYHAHQIIKDNIKTQINFTDLKTVLFFLGITESQFLN